MRTRRPRSIVAAVFLIAWGVIFLVAELGRLDVGDLLHRWWPMMLVLLALTQLVDGRRSRAGTLALLVVGVIFQLVQLELVPWATLGKVWPLALIAAGISLIWKR